jgi:hypothetical protein
MPIPHKGAVALVNDRKMNQIFATARMHSPKAAVPHPLEQIFGIASFELGKVSSSTSLFTR